MQVEQSRWTRREGWWSPGVPADTLGADAHLVLAFGSPALIRNHDLVHALRQRYPAADFLGCSTAGEILGTQVTDDSLVATAVRFASSRVAGVTVSITETPEAFDAGVKLADALEREGLVHVFVVSDGLQVNGSALVAGLASRLERNVTV